MNKKISLEMWLRVFFGGIWQFLRRIFSWKNRSVFWRVIWAVIAVCIVAFTGMLGYAFYDEFHVRKERYAQYDDWQISPDFKFRNNGRNNGNSYIYDVRTKKKILKGIDWIAANGDSLTVVAKDGKRGYVNRFTGKTALPFKYDAAWSFVDGAAAVCEGDSVYFIDHSGKPINGRKFPRRKDYNSYVYHGNYAAIPMDDKFGLVDKSGNWVLLPEYSQIYIGAKNSWYVIDNGKWGVFGPSGQFVVPLQYEQVWIHGEDGITVANARDHSQSRYDYDGTLLDEFIFDEVHEMTYLTDEFDDDGDQKCAVDNMLKYSANHYWGLMSRDGKPVTPPIYRSIDCVTPGVYQCKVSPYTSDCVLVNAKGEKING